MLPNCLLKRKWNVISCCWKAKLGTLHTEKNYLLALFTFVHGEEGDSTTSPSFSSGNRSTDASKTLLEAKWNVISCCWKAKLGALNTEKDYLLALFTICSWGRGI